MSAFEVNITPTRNNPINKIERQPTDVVLAPFTAKATVTFEDVPISKTARRILNVINPSDEGVKVMLTRTFNPEYNMWLEWTSTVIPPNDCKTLEMTWNPTKELQCREIIQFTDNRNFRKEVSVILKSIKKTKTGTKRFPTLSSGSISKCTLKLKPQVQANISNRKSAISNNKTAMIQKQFQELKTRKDQDINSRHLDRNTKTLPCRNENTQRSLFRESNKINDINSRSALRNYERKNKENMSPLAPTNASTLFDNFKFTPVTEQQSIKYTENILTLSPDLEYYTSLPTPVTIKASKNYTSVKPLSLSFSPEFQTNLIEPGSNRSDCLISLHKSNNDIENSDKNYFTLKSVPKMFIEEEKENCIEPQLSPGRTYTQDSVLDTSSEPRKSLGVPLINRTFVLKNQTTSENILLPQRNENLDVNLHSDSTKSIKNQMDCVDCTDKKNTRLSSIAEIEESFRLEPKKKIEKSSPSSHNLKRDVKLVGTPLRKCSESLRDLSGKSRKSSMGAMGSMPDLNNMETLQSIEQNRYYYQQNQKSSSGSLNMSPKIYKNTDLLNISNESCISNAEIQFNQNEIRAASSRFNVNDVINPKIGKTTSPLRIKQESITPSPLRIKREQLTPSHNKHKSPLSSPHTIDFKRNHHEIDSPTSSSNNLIPRPSTSIAISPSKRIRYDTEFSVNNISSATNPFFRVVNWKTTQPVKKLRIQKSLSLVRKPITPRKIKDEPRQMLYNSENFLQHFINPDPFAATTIVDPFLATTMYLEEESVQKYEIQFKKWLNALVSMPSELDPNCEEKVDVGRLFNEVRNKELILAPTKEEQSMNYLTKSRMEALRSAAINLYMSEEMCVVCSKVAVHIKRGALKIRVDRDLHLDVVMQRTILELLLCFNPLWLRLGLEVVFGEVIHLHSNSDIIGLSTFILNRLFRDKFIERKYSKAYTLSEEYRTHMKSFTLQKILFLLLFLDKAKNYRIIKHNPCLFVKKSQYKETKEVLLRMSSELLASIGDITRELRRFGYILSHKQCFIDEFDYAFKNLAIELRDGVRLTRIMEIILLKDNLTNQLRCPAISRLQRIFNVNLALKALNEADFKLKGDISAYDIVDGHREKTLSLLWQIIYKFRSPKFIAAATTIQKWWRKNWLRVMVCRRIKIKEEKKRQKAATIIQALLRGFITRKYVKIYKEKRINAVVCLQKYCRKYLERSRFIKIKRSVINIQRWFRNEKIAMVIRSNYLELKFATIFIQAWYRRIKLARKIELAAPIIQKAKSNAKLHYEKAIVIQRCIKSYVMHKKFAFVVNNILEYVRKNKLEYRSANKIQAFIKGAKVRREYQLQKISVQKIQVFWRSYWLGKIERARFLGKRQAVIAIQTYFRSYLVQKFERRYYLKLRSSVVLIQNRFRANIICKKEKVNYEKLRSSTITIQQRFRAILLMKQARNEYKMLLKTTLMIQCRFRANRLCRLQASEYQKLKHSITIIQSSYRGLVARRRYKILKEKTIIIQRQLRATILFRKVRYQFVTLQYHTILMQQRFRANKLMQQEKLKYIELRNATMIVQRRFRAIIAMKQQRCKYLRLREKVIVTQIRFRAISLMRRERINFIRLQNATLIIQRRYRAIKSMQSKRNQYQSLLRATINIQRRFKANRLMKKERKNFVALRSSAIIIQFKYKALITMRAQKEKYTLMKNSAIILQRRYRAYKLMRIEKLSYELLYTNVVKIQQRFRANCLMKKDRQNYLAIKKSTIILQTRWKALMKMRKDKKNYMLIRKSTIYIQQKYKAYKLMKFHLQKYEVQREKIIRIQQIFRANSLMKKEREQYLTMYNATLILQSRWRALIKMRKERHNFLVLKKSAIVIQQRYRANKLMHFEQTYYENLYIAVLNVQQIFRANFLMKREKSKYANIRNSAIKIQSWLRATFEMRNQRKKYILLKATCKKIQEKFRANISMKIERKKFIKFKNSAIIIQRYYRSTIMMRKCRSEYLQLKSVTSIIQRRFRDKIIMRFHRSTYINMKKSVVVIQRAFRSYCQMKEQRETYLKLRSTVIIIQQKYRATKKMYLKRNNYLKLISSIKCLQTYCRGFLARKRFNTAMTPQMKEFIKQRSAAKTIQRFWRGYMVRNKWNNVRIRLIRQKIKELKNTSNVCNTVKYKISTAVKFLNGKRSNVQEELSILLRLEKLSRTVPHFLIDYSKVIATFCYGIMAQAIRSELDKQIIEICSRIMLNLARYSITANTFQEDGLVTIAQMLLRWCDKESDIFNTLCTLIWIFSHCPIKNKIIKAFMTTPEAIFMLRETKKLVLRKEKMRQNVRRSSIASTPTKKMSDYSLKALPSLEPDFGIIQGKPYIFVSSVFAFDVILNSLGIKEIY